MTGLADKNMLGWLEWAYTGNDKTSSSPNGQALVLDPAQPPTGANVLTRQAEGARGAVPAGGAGTPSRWSFTGGVFTLKYSTTRASGLRPFPCRLADDDLYARRASSTGYRSPSAAARWCRRRARRPWS